MSPVELKLIFCPMSQIFFWSVDEDEPAYCNELDVADVVNDAVVAGHVYGALYILLSYYSLSQRKILEMS